MPIPGKFVINNQEMSTLTMFGVGSFPAYSGNKKSRNRVSDVAVPMQGPIPPGKYYIVDRPTGGWKGVIRTDLHDFYSWPTPTPVIKAEWFALYRQDGKIDDFTWINGVKRGNFRLHPPGPLGISEGCVTLKNRTDFLTIRQSLLSTQLRKLPNGLVTYGEIEVVTDGN